MRSLRTVMIFLAFIAVSGSFLPGNARCEIIDRTIATVNGDIVLYSEIQEQIKAMEQMVPEVKSYPPEKKADLEKELLKQIIRQRLTEQEVKRLKIYVANSELDQTVDSIRKENNLTQKQFEDALKQTGQTLEKFRADLKKELERNRLLERVLKTKTLITDQQVDAYLKGKSTDSLVTGRVRLGLIYLPFDQRKGNVQEVEKAGREILDQLKRGAEFQKMAVQYSKGPAAQEGGDIGLMAPDELAPYIASGIQGLQKDQISNLVRGPQGYYIFKILGFDTQTQSKSDTSVREKARKELYDKELDRKFDEWVRSLEAKAFINISL